MIHARNPRRIWSIGLYSGPSPFLLAPIHGRPGPILTGNDVNDISCEFVADPFLYVGRGKYHIFFEIMTRRMKGVIALATSLDGHVWSYEQVVLEESFHLSYPFIFEHGGECYLIPESKTANSVRLYREKRFPYQWEFLTTLINRPLNDPTVFRWDNLWWLFASVGHDMLCLYYAKELDGQWCEHPFSPVVRASPHKARPAGRVIAFDERLFRLAQDCKPVYGLRVKAIEITQLSTSVYSEQQEGIELVRPGHEAWNRSGMHHVDAHQLQDGTWLASVDGWQSF